MLLSLDGEWQPFTPHNRGRFLTIEQKRFDYGWHVRFANYRQQTARPSADASTPNNCAKRPLWRSSASLLCSLVAKELRARNPASLAAAMSGGNAVRD